MPLKQDVIQPFTCLTAIVWMICVPGRLEADVIRDGTLGPGASIQPTGPHFEIPESFGELNGTNLFHSFQEFSLSEDQSATFGGTSTIHNIIGRVTGGNVSHIDGLLQSTVPGADLYLMNPQGVIFGANAQLDMQGAFHVSTAGTLIFSGGDVFNAMGDGGPHILSTAVPEQFGFLGTSAAPIELNGATLASRHDVALGAGAIALRDGASIVTATDSPLAAADIALTALAWVSMSGIDEFGRGSGLDATTHGNGPSGQISVAAPRIELQDGAWMSASTTSAGGNGAVRLVADEHLILSGRDGHGQPSSLQAMASADGNAGLIDLEAPVIELRDGAYATTATTGAGNGGELLVTATERISLSGKNSEGFGAAFLASAAEAGGGSGTVRAIAPVIELHDGANMTTTTAGAGDGGDVLIIAGQRLTLSGNNDEGFGASLQASTHGDGAAGDVFVTAPLVELQEGAWMESNTTGGGVGGKLAVTASERLTLSGTDDNGFGSSLQTMAIGAGAAGMLTVEAPVIELRDGGFMRANTAGANRGGALTVNASERLVLSGTDDRGLGARLEANAQERGDAVGIEIEAPEIVLTDGAAIASASVGAGDAGSINIVAGDMLKLVDQSVISTSAFTASGGNIDIQAGLIHLGDSDVSTNVGSGPGGGGDIAIASDVLVLDRSRITAQADSGSGGNIQITARDVLATPNSIIDASAGPAGVDGDVAVTNPETDLDNELARPAAEFLDASVLLRAGCEARSHGSRGSLTVAHQQGLPLSPEHNSDLPSGE